jgi:peptide/nickel transport system substrate-binding protein
MNKPKRDIRSLHYGRAAGLALLLCSALAHGEEPKPLNILLDAAPSTLNPRLALDAAGQRLDELIFSGLIRLDINLSPVPALAESWKTEENGKLWRFKIRSDARDHAGQAIRASDLVACLASYRTGKPLSPFAADFPAWTTTEATPNNEVVIHLSEPDPYLLHNLTLLRYFRTSSSATPCAEPKNGDTITGSGIYKLANAHYDGLFPESELNLLPTVAGPRPLHFIFSLDENSKAIRMLRGEIDVAYYSISIAKTRWFQNKHPELFQVLEREGVPITYIAFNLKNPILANKKVRRAIALSLDRSQYIRYKLSNLAVEDGSILPPMLPESADIHIPYDPAEAKRLLDQAGYPRRADGTRFEITIKTTPSRDGLEVNQVFQNMLAQVGITIRLEIIEPAVFFASIRKRNFQMYTSRWIGIADGSIYYRIMDSKGVDNRASYNSPQADRLLAQAAHADPEHRILLMRQIQNLMAEDLPYLPLWHSKITILVKQGLKGLESSDLSLSASLVPLSKLR